MDHATAAASGARRRLLRAAQIALPIAGMMAALYVLWRTVDFGKALRVVREADPVWVLLAFGCAMIPPLLASTRVWLLARSVGIGVAWRVCWNAVMASISVGLVLPGKSGEFAKIYFLCGQREQVARIAGAVVLERVLDILVLAVLSLCGGLIQQWTEAVLGAAAVAGGALFGLIALRLAHRLPAPRLAARLAEAGEAARRLGQSPGIAGAVILLTVAVWIALTATVWLMLRAVGAGPPLAATMIAAPLAILAGAMPVSVSGIGTRDGVLVLLLSPFASAPVVLAASFLYTVVVRWLLALLGLAALGGETLRKARK